MLETGDLGYMTSCMSCMCSVDGIIPNDFAWNAEFLGQKYAIQEVENMMYIEETERLAMLDGINCDLNATCE